MSKPPVTKNQKLTLTISDLTYQGMGVGKVDHYPLFIEDALPDEVVDITVMKASKNYGFAKVINRHNDSPLRTAGINKTYTQTGIAPLQHLKYDAQLSFKRNQVVELLKKSHLEEIEVAPVLGMDEPVHYRNKAQVPVRMVKNQLETGFFKKNSHNFVPMEDYLIQDERIDEVIKSVRNILRKYMISAYDEKTHKGVVRHIIVRRGYYSHEVMVVLVTRAKKIPESDEIVDEILKACPDVRTVVQNVNQEKTNVILGKTEKILAGDGRITDSLNGINFEISAHSFYQVNSIQTEKIYQKVVEAAELTGKETVIDAYCGIGTISLNLAQKAEKVYGVEIVPEAIADAKKNATVNDINNTTFEVGTASEWMSKWSEDGIKPDVVVFDPPRKGLEPEVINSTVKLSPEKIVYVSCNPATLVRDIQLFTEQGYQVVKPIQPVDQFPMTTHIESVTVLKRVAGK
ncbi:23S rRNA (uracil(1939)-C(5))-methyltransferase RlmD [Liquorilactobacillus hordei]|uniref:tRNA (Uracil-5-)-methyltransferase n=1 Tax=Liquorilactobacillus hordei DSM 19519 TaxID=1423759 RepID=A0A0R1MV55_9LACO|nr:23S rRNA (uracil(1939)-C(5))-methyltransferase RlmD [Liquorilactobacillus hordei]KRL08155.1 tRNA (Uracil-5-) -methyltransferase [Liquorilactobacillus hordei DSM 19519]QYH51767.1 23S rRNA (uracil(1939)-C(5))-methyltransferase RlmD [Liquorilactobacillus hordei DSM 19519]